MSGIHHSDTATHADGTEIDTDLSWNTASRNMKILKFPNTHSPALHQQQCMNIYILWDHLQTATAGDFVFPNSSRKLSLFDVIWKGWGSSLRTSLTYFYPLCLGRVRNNDYWQQLENTFFTLMLILDISDVNLRLYSWRNLKSGVFFFSDL